MSDMKRFVQALEEVLDDIYRRYGRLKATDLDKKVNETLDAALTTAAKTDAMAPEVVGGRTGRAISKEEINNWTNAADQAGRMTGLSGKSLSDFITEFVQKKIAEA
jgi:hypothetical protein